MLASAGLLSIAVGLEVHLLALEGDPRAGEEVPLEVLVHEQGVPVSAPIRVTASEGSVVAVQPGDRPGRHKLRYRAERAGADRLTVTVGATQAVVTVDVQTEPSPAASLPRRVRGTVGQPVSLSLGTNPTGGPWQVATSEGTASVSEESGASTLEWTPSADPFPRAVAVGVLHPSRADRAPAFSVIRLSGRPRIPITVSEPRTQVTVRVGNRTYGPFTAGDDGVVAATAEVRPGETTAEVLLTDAAGNTQRSQVSLGGSARPALVALPRPAGPGSLRGGVVELFAVDAGGKPWRGPGPTCRSSVGQAAPTTALAPGRWRAAVPPPPPGAFFDVRLDCTLANKAQASARLPVGTPRPAGLRLEAFPRELAADTPTAQVQAYLESARGERLGSTGISLTAAEGTFAPLETPDQTAVRATYDGSDAVPFGEAQLTAAWSPSAHTGTALGVELAAARAAGRVRVAARGRGSRGPVLAGPVSLEVDGQGQAVEPDDQGWARAEAAATGPGPVVVRATLGGHERQVLLLPTETVGNPEPGPDLTASLVLPIRTGRVRSVRLDLAPRIVEAVPGETARVTVHLLDEQGSPVADESLDLAASLGVVTRPRRRSDGSYEATWAPPPSLPFGDVRITATSAEGAFADTSTELEVVPRVVRRAPGLVAGWVLGQAGLSSPFVGLTGDLRVPRLGERIYLRAALGFYGHTVQDDDVVSGEAILLDLDLFPVEAGLLLREERGRLAGWVGGSGIAAPYALDARFGGSAVAQGLYLASPGLSLFTGGSWRLRGGELSTELSYKFVTLSATDVGWEGNVGGIVLTAGYRLLL